MTDTDRSAQTPTNVGTDGLSFAKDGFRYLLTNFSTSDLRIGARFTQGRAKYVHAALRDAAQTIDRMPSTFMTYPMGARILPVERSRVSLAPSMIALDVEYLAASRDAAECGLDRADADR